MNTFKYFTLLLLSSFFILNSCTSDPKPNEDEKPKPVTVDQLNGRWDLADAVRDGDKTTSLAGTFIDISGNKMVCNFTGEEVDSEFTFKDNELKHGGQTYKVDSFSENEIVLSTKLMDFNFKLTFNKAQE